jgi:hypothetical protein
MTVRRGMNTPANATSQRTPGERFGPVDRSENAVIGRFPDKK